MKREWLQKKLEATDWVSIIRQEILESGLSESDRERLLKELMANGPKLGGRWDKFISEMQSGDELWYFKSPPETWSNRSGRAGYAIVRGSEVISHYITWCN